MSGIFQTDKMKLSSQETVKRHLKNMLHIITHFFMKKWYQIKIIVILKMFS